MQGASGALSIIVPLGLAAAGASPSAIGLVMAAYAAGFLLGARWTPREIARIGHIRAFVVFAAVNALAALALAISVDVATWLVIQVILGAGVAGLMTTGESWIADAAPPAQRGAILSFYLVVSKLGFVAGPFLMAGRDPAGPTALMILAALFAMALLPIAVTDRAQPAPPAAAPFGIRQLWDVAPAAVIAALAAGAINGAVLQLYSIYAAPLNLEAPNVAAALFNTAMTAGALLAQWPAGVLSDRIDRRLVIAGLSIAAALASAGLAIVPSDAPEFVVYGLAVAWGAGSLSFYGVAVAHAADRAQPGQTTSMMAGILMLWAMGAIVGPLVAGAAMDVGLGRAGLFAFAAIGLALLPVAMLARRRAAEPVAGDAKSAFAPAGVTSVAITDLDPRAAEETPAAPPPAEEAPS
ncbi:MAG: MFS transporter [Alphaproteobacteria bacterium]|nr:MFS transporter [Alphaproteobacteria bacterium]